MKLKNSALQELYDTVVNSTINAEINKDLLNKVCGIDSDD